MRLRERDKRYDREIETLRQQDWTGSLVARLRRLWTKPPEPEPPARPDYRPLDYAAATCTICGGNVGWGHPDRHCQCRKVRKMRRAG